MQSDNVIRFTVGTPVDIRSTVWRLWSRGRDLYLASRSHAGVSKFSFHQSGKYRYAINEETPLADVSKDRALYKWQRPKEFVPGWTRCLGILVPPRITHAPFAKDLRTEKDIVFVAPPDHGSKVVFNIVLSHKAATREHVVRGSSHNVEVLGCVTMPHELAWLVVFRDIFTPAENNQVKDHFDKLKIHLKSGDNGDGIKSTFLHIIEFNEMPFLIDIELGKENLDLAN